MNAARHAARQFEVSYAGIANMSEESGKGSLVIDFDVYLVAVSVEDALEGMGIGGAYGCEPVGRHIQIASKIDGIAVDIGLIMIDGIGQQGQLGLILDSDGLEHVGLLRELAGTEVVPVAGLCLRSQRHQTHHQCYDMFHNLHSK